VALYAIGDLHLSLNSDKPMDIFGPGWLDYVRRIEEGFSVVSEEDTTVLCGDLTWGMSLEESLRDFQFINALPGKKLLLKGNHDYWWNTAKKMTAFFAEHELNTLQILYNNAYAYGDYSICGTRGWFYELDNEGTRNGKMVAREAGRLEASLQAGGNKEKLCFLHYPPLYTGYRCPEILEILQKYNVKLCCYGHLHGASHRRRIEGNCGGTEYSLVAADFLKFIPKKICD